MDVLFGDDEFTGLYDADLPRADLVQAPANGVDEWIVMKDADGEAGLLDPEFVRDLIGKQAEPEPSGRERVQMPNGVTLTGSPAAMAAFIHKASVRAEGDGNDVAKAEMSGKSQNDLPDSAFAYIEPGGKKDEDGKTTPRSLRHFPIHDAAHVRNALSRAPQSPFGDKAMPKIRAAARKFGIEVSKEEAAVAETVTKDMSGAMAPELDDGIDGLDPTVPLAAPDEDAPGNPAEPGSPAWEAIDAATEEVGRHRRAPEERAVHPVRAGTPRGRLRRPGRRGARLESRGRHVRRRLRDLHPGRVRCGRAGRGGPGRRGDGRDRQGDDRRGPARRAGHRGVPVRGRQGRPGAQCRERGAHPRRGAGPEHRPVLAAESPAHR